MGLRRRTVEPDVTASEPFNIRIIAPAQNTGQGNAPA